MAETQLDRIEKDIRDVKLMITGNGNPEKGIASRLVILEEHDRGRTVRERVLFGAAASSVIGFIGTVVFLFIQSL